MYRLCLWSDTQILNQTLLLIYKSMKELEFLLNLLLKMGRKPYWQTKFKKIKVSSNIYNKTKRRIIVEFDWWDFWNYYKLCDVVSINSWLRQFVCKNNLHKKGINNFREKVYRVWGNAKWFECNYEYRLLESTLIPEKELEQFLLDNIKAECHLKYEIKLD